MRYVQLRGWGRSTLLGLVLSSWSASFALSSAASDPDPVDPLNPPSERFYSSVDFGFDFELEERDTDVRGSIRPRSSTDEFSSPAFRLGWLGEGSPLVGVWGSPRPIARAGLKWVYVSTSSDSGNFVPSEPGDELEAITTFPVSTRPPNQQQAARLVREARLAQFDPEANEGFEVDYRDGPTPGFYAGLGLSFDRAIPGTEFPGWFSIRPTFEWSMRRYSLRGGFTQVDLTAVAPTLDLTDDPNETLPAAYEVTQSFDTMSFWEHRIGPSLELETGLRDRKSFAVSLFFAARLQFLLSRAVHTWGNPNSISTTLYDRLPDDSQPMTLSSAGKSVRFRSESKPLVVSLGGGLRFYWF